MINVGDLLTVRLYGGENKSIYTDNLFLVHTFPYNAEDNNDYYNIVELTSGYSPWTPFKSLEELNSNILNYLHVVKTQHIKDFLKIH